MDYGTAKTLFTGFLNRSDHLPSLNDMFFGLSLTRIHRSLKIPIVEKKTTLTAGARSDFPLPSDFLGLRRLYTDTRTLVHKPFGDFIRLPDDYGEPWFYTREAGVWLVKDRVAAGGTLNCLYHASSNALVHDSDEPPLMVHAGDLVVWGALCAASDWYEDDNRGPRWENKFSSLLEDVYLDGLDREMETHRAIEPATTCEY